MEKLDINIVIIDDDIRVKEDPFIIEANLIFSSIHFFEDPEEGLNYISQNLGNKTIILLDLSFPQNVPDGHKILERIRKLSFILPVIIWSGKDEDKETFSDLINNKAFSFIKKSASSQEIIDKLIEAADFLKYNINAALDDWINDHSEDQKAKPYMISVQGKSFSLNDILKEVRLQSEIGKHFAKQLTSLTIDLLSRNKEKLND